MLLFLSVLFFFTIRLLPRMLFSSNDYMGTDKWNLFYYTKAYKQNGYFKFKQWPGADISGPPHVYPPLFLFFLSLFSKDRLLKIEHYFSTFIQFGTYLIIVIFSMYLSGRLYPERTILFGIYTGLIIAFLPCLFGPNSGIVFTSARPLGVFLANLSLINLYFSSIGYSVIHVILFFIFFFLSAISSRFAIQTVLFIGIIYGLLLMKPLIMILPILALILSLTLGYCLYWPIFKHHFRHVVIYKKVFEKTTVDMLEKHKKVSQAIFSAVQRIKKKEYSEVLREIYNSALIRIILMNPFTILVLIAGLVFYGSFQEELRSLYMLLLAGIIVSIATSRQKLKFLGEAERYLEFGCLFPTCFLMVHLTDNLVIHNLFWGIIIYSVFFAFFSFRIHPRIHLNSLNEVIDFLKGLGPKKIIVFPTMCYPIILALTDMKVPYIEGWQLSDHYYNNIEELKKRWSYLYGIFPGPNTETLDEQIREFKIDYILYCEDETSHSQRSAALEKLKEYRPLFCNDGYSVYSAKN